ncbi:glycosyltransferase [Epilithonimonas hispanica]|uniref:Glycosyltransferase n=1 Tax=Epilithonimonas hispanica TaxID=358687 RepID=A0A3D9D2S5_9FLAO|nr:glycosyltransferase [Epilithonimonas hispanica]REC72295.1 glycosyltransferase [Epilithonimonas hispanica]
MKHLVIIGLVIPEPASTAAGYRMMQLIKLFSEANYTITFLTSSNNIEFSEKIEIQKIDINNESFDEKIKDLNPDIVLFDRYVTEEQFGWRVSENCPNALKIIDTEDLHFLREARRKAFVEKRETSNEDLINDIFKREMASILRCDLSLIISEFEYQLLTEKFKINPDILFYIPFFIENIEKNKTAFEERQHFVSIGNFLHEPNWQTVLKLKSIWKNIRKELPNVELHIYGAYASEKVFQLHNEKESFLVKGRAEDVKLLFNQYRVLLAPIPFGAGLKGKLWESMQFGLPNVTSSIGAEAMHKNLPWNGFIEDSDEGFVTNAVELYQNESIWNQANKNANEILKQIFDKKLYVNQFWGIISKIENNLEAHRTENYLGKILQHHQLNSTKYMGRWIEEKNRKQ